MKPLFHLGTLSLLMYARKHSYWMAFAQSNPKSFLPGPPEKHLFLNRFQCKTCYTSQSSGRKTNHDTALMFSLLLTLGHTLTELQNTSEMIF